MMPRTVFQGTQVSQWYRDHLFVKQASLGLVNAERARIRTLEWKPSAQIRVTGRMLCSTRSIDRITVPASDACLLERVGLKHLGDAKNRELARRLREIP